MRVGGLSDALNGIHEVTARQRLENNVSLARRVAEQVKESVNVVVHHCGEQNGQQHAQPKPGPLAAREEFHFWGG